MRAAYVAGKLQMKEAIPILRQLEQSEWSGRSTSRGYSTSGKHDGVVDPFTYSTFTIRQVAQLSLRRLGEVPQQLPAMRFKMINENGDHEFKPVPLKQSRHTRVSNLRIGMKAEQVLTLIGSPDFVSRETWDYDIDNADPYTLVVSWDGQQVKEITRKSPPVWQDGETRDETIVY